MTFETYSFTDLLKHGLDNYVNDEYFTPLIACTYGMDAGDVKRFDFIADYGKARSDLIETLGDKAIAAHNAGFEQTVLDKMGVRVDSRQFVDTAVLARAAGAAGKLEAAAPQLLGSDKIDTGMALIKLFSIPGEYQAKVMNGRFDPQIVEDHPGEWEEFFHYCQVDAELSWRLAIQLLPSIPMSELVNNAVTMDMNNTGWHVDLPLVKEMQRRYEDNVKQTVDQFRLSCDAWDLNLSSFPQLQAWCEERGVKAKSFDEDSVHKMLDSLRTRMASRPTMEPAKRQAYQEVIDMLITKQAMGGSSLKKLQTILDRTGPDSRLRDSYLHVGAGATYRTSGRGVQMQNLKRLNGQGDDVKLLFDADVTWPNDRLASNLRQVFCATDPDGKLIVGDFSSVESRGLAWQAGEQWKLDAYTQGIGVYESQAAKFYNIPLNEVSKEQRSFGKVGELSCGYGAGAEAVRDFAAKMGVTMSEMEAAVLVKDWRGHNPHTVKYWYALDDALHKALAGQINTVTLPHGRVVFSPINAPESLAKQVGLPNLVSVEIRMYLDGGTKLLTRVIHGLHMKGRNIGYWKPSERKTGDLWINTFTNPKTKRTEPYTMWGGKLAGLLTQSLCREMFFASLRDLSFWAERHENIRVVGQFHDEIVVDWSPVPGKPDLPETMTAMQKFMTTTVLPGFPLDAEIKSDYRYTK